MRKLGWARHRGMTADPVPDVEEFPPWGRFVMAASGTDDCSSAGALRSYLINSARSSLRFDAPEVVPVRGEPLHVIRRVG